MKKTFIIKKVTVILLGLLLCIVMLEIGIRIVGFVFVHLQEYRNRISIKQKGTYCIMCLGESTTALGGEDSYPRQLEEILNQQDIGIKFSVINKGIPGIHSGPIMSQLENNLDKYTPDMVITMMGANDGRRDILPYEDVTATKTRLFLKWLRTYKLVKLFRQQIVNKTREIGNRKLKEKKEGIPAGINNLTQPSNFKEQEKMYKKAIEINPKNNKPYVELGLCYRDQEKYHEAEEILKKAIEINPEDEWAYFALGRCYREQGKYDKAEEILKKAIEINPKNNKPHIELGVCYKEQRKYDKAEEIFRKAIEVESKHDTAYIELGWCYSDQRKYDKAEEMFKKAIELDPESDKSCGLLALLYVVQGKNKSAAKYLRKTNRLRLETYNPMTRRNYQKLKEVVTQRGMRLVCVQYPMRSVKPLKKMLKPHEGIIFVDNETVFKKALQQEKCDEYFRDMCYGDFGHCTAKGNKLLAENIADVILKEYFDKSRSLLRGIKPPKEVN